MVIIQQTDGCTQDDVFCLEIPKDMDVELEKRKMYLEYAANQCPIQLVDYLVEKGAILLQVDTYII
jgi:hypothetical protein